VDLPSRIDLFNVGAAFVLDRSRRIDPARVYVLGSDVNLFVGSQSVVGYTVVKQLAYRTAALLLDAARGTDLDRYAWDRYQLTRKGASPALSTARFFRASSALGAGTIPSGTTINTLTGVAYVTTTDATFGALDVDNVTAYVRASQAGKATEVGANQIRRFANAQALFDPTIQVTNDLTTAGGEDAEDDDTFRNRIRSFWLTARRGVLSAIEFGATSVPGVVSAQAVEALSSSGLPARVVNLYIADSSGVASAALANQVAIALGDYRAAGIAVVIYTSIPQLVPVSLNLSFAAGTDTVALSSNVIAAVVEFVNSLPVNGTLAILQLGAVFQRFAASGLIVGQGMVASPVGDVIPAPGQTLRTTASLVTLAGA
jgi:uncharacterized phage protein gp47/JayE